MKKLSQKQKRWNITKSRKRMIQLSKIKRRKNRRRRGVGRANQSFDAQYTHRLHAPEKLSILNDVNQKTLKFFDYAINTIQKCKIHERIYFDFEDIVGVTADAIMYVIALINNYKRITLLNIYKRKFAKECRCKKIYRRYWFLFVCRRINRVISS